MASRSGADGNDQRGGRPGPDVLSLLVADHRRVQQLLDDFEDSDGDEAEQIELAQQICDELRVHARVEEELFYPAARRALDEDGARLLDEALVEHASADDLIAKVEASDPADALFRAQVRVLGVYVEHHMLEEESELFALLRESTLDRHALGAALQARRDELLADMGLDPEVAEESDDDEPLADAEEPEEAVPPPLRAGRRGSRPAAH
jgi:hypothetical protein